MGAISPQRRWAGKAHVVAQICNLLYRAMEEIENRRYIWRFRSHGREHFASFFGAYTA